MIEDPPVLTIKRNIPRPSPDMVAALRALPTSIISDAMGGKGCLAPGIAPLAGFAGTVGRIAGPALTADCGPGDILALQAALDQIYPGDIVVCAFGGHLGCASIGDRVAAMIKNAGGIGFVTDGALRDADGCDEVGLPIWAAGITPASPGATGPGRVGLPITTGGQAVDAGDIIVADRDGVVVVPRLELNAVLARALEVEDLERQRDQEVRDGLIVPPNIHDLLASDRVKYID